MRFRNTLIVLVLFAALGGYAYFAEVRGKGTSSEAATESAASPLWNMQAADVVQFEVKGPEGSTHLEREKDAPWNLIDAQMGNKQPADDARVTRMVEALTGLQASRTFTNTSDLGEYGLSSPQWTVELLLQDGSAQTLQWGDQTPQGSGYYIRIGKESIVRVVPTFTIEDLERLVREPAYLPTPTIAPTATIAATEMVTGTVAIPTVNALSTATKPPTAVRGTVTPSRGAATGTPSVDKK